MICPVSLVRYCGEFASHPDSMYLHMIHEHSPEELSLALMAYGYASAEVRVTSSDIFKGAEEQVDKLEVWFSETLKDYKRQKVTTSKGYMDICPECGEKYNSQCKCDKSDRSCPNGHHWHHHPRPHNHGPQAYHGEGNHSDGCGPGTLQPCEPVVLGKQVNA